MEAPPKCGWHKWTPAWSLRVWTLLFLGYLVINLFIEETARENWSRPCRDVMDVLSAANPADFWRTRATTRPFELRGAAVKELTLIKRSLVPQGRGKGRGRRADMRTCVCMHMQTAPEVTRANEVSQASVIHSPARPPLGRRDCTECLSAICTHIWTPSRESLLRQLARLSCSKGEELTEPLTANGLFLFFSWVRFGLHQTH